MCLLSGAGRGLSNLRLSRVNYERDSSEQRTSPLRPDYVRFGERTESLNACSEEQSALDIAGMRRFNEENQCASPSAPLPRATIFR